MGELPDWGLDADYKVERRLGWRVHGEAVIALEKASGKRVVIERISTSQQSTETAGSFSSTASKASLLKELQLLRELKHESILDLVEVRKHEKRD